MSSISYCSHNSRDVSLEAPIGSASAFSRALLFEVPLPWSRVPLETPHIPQSVTDAITTLQNQQGKVSVYLLAPDSSYAVDGARLIDIQVVDGEVNKREIIATDGDLAGVIQSLAVNEELPAAAFIDPTPWRDLAVCTHGSRDACCASFGAPMYIKMHSAAKSLPNTRVWRCSHLGGHRFAPTMIDLPSGRVWGLVDDEAARGILLGDSDPAALVPHYRGWVGHKQAELQMLEAHLLEHFGWSWTEYSQQGEVLERDDEGRAVRVRITGSHPTLEPVCFEGEIQWGDEFSTIASCNATPVTYIRKNLMNPRAAQPVALGAD